MMVEPFLERAAALRPDRPALESAGGVLTYAELLARARAGAAGLTARGVRPRDRVALLLPAGEAFVVALHAALLAGAAAMPVDLRLGERERAPQLASAATVVEAPLPGRGGARGADVATGAPPLVVHTSGTTGDPPPPELRGANVLANALGTAVAIGHDRAERWLCPLPLTHVGGLMVLLRSAIYATTAVLGPADRPDVTLASLVPTQLTRLLEAGTPPPRTLRTVM